MSLHLQPTRMPNPIECLSDVEKNTPAILSPLTGRGNGINDAKTLLNSKVKGSETKLVEGNDLLRFKDREQALEWQETDWPVGAWFVWSFRI